MEVYGSIIPIDSHPVRNMLPSFREDVYCRVQTTQVWTDR